VSGTRITLYAIGGAFEVVGIVLAAAPDSFRIYRAGVDFARRTATRAATVIEDAARRLLRRRRDVVIQVPAGTAKASAGRPTILKIVPTELAIEEQVRLLIERDKEAQERLNALEANLDDEVDRRRQALADLRDELRRYAKDAARRAVDEHQRLRMVGLGLLLVGTIFVNFGNFA
jgi:hypothetical protein